jgi:uncharacterized protein involved in type VI secretion and phage assembly
MDNRTARFIEESGRKHWGKYRGFVDDRDDPDKLGRLKVRVPSLLADALPGWAWPVTPYGGAGVGLFALPKKDDIVWVEFMEGDLAHPLWTGCAWAKPGGRSEVPQEALDAYPNAVVLRTASGNTVVLSDVSGHEVITVRAANGAEVVLDAAADRITVRAAEVVVRGAGGDVEELATKSFVKDVFDLHQHATGVGPSSAPTLTSTSESLTTVLKAE